MAIQSSATFLAREYDKSEVEQQARVIDTIPLFGSRKLVLDDATSTWIYLTATTEPERLTRRESMFINAALRVAGGR